MAVVKQIALISASTRTPRLGPEVASLIKELIVGDDDAAAGLQISSVDLADFKLPVYDEAVIPAMVPAQASFSKPHSIAWSAEIAKYDGYIFVTPEYNFGLPGGIKNAIDYLYNEWIGKGAAVISYGIKGGTLASGQLNETLTGMKLRVAPTRPALSFHDGAGPDLYLAMGSGKLGEDTKKDFLAQSPSILQALKELKGLVNDTNTNTEPNKN